MSPHKFVVGQKVRYLPQPYDPHGTGGRYTVVRLLPSETRDHQYRVKNDSDGHERVVRESQLSMVPTRSSPSDLWDTTVKPS